MKVILNALDHIKHYKLTEQYTEIDREIYELLNWCVNIKKDKIKYVEFNILNYKSFLVPNDKIGIYDDIKSSVNDVFTECYIL